MKIDKLYKHVSVDLGDSIIFFVVLFDVHCPLSIVYSLDDDGDVLSNPYMAIYSW